MPRAVFSFSFLFSSFLLTTTWRRAAMSSAGRPFALFHPGLGLKRSREAIARRQREIEDRASARLRTVNYHGGFEWPAETGAC
jgi:hypothetical protein